MKRKAPIVRASSSPPVIAFQCSGKVSIKAAEADGTPKKKPTFDVTAYTGGALVVGGHDHPIVVDIASLKYARSIKANLGHDRDKRVGHVTNKTVTASQIDLQGVFSAANAYRNEVVESAASDGDDGYEWEASIEASPGQREFIKAGKKVTVNGQEFSGPIYVGRNYTLTQFAFVDQGADLGNHVNIAANRVASSSTEKEMEIEAKFKSWLVARNWNPDELSDEQVSTLQAAYDADNGKKKKKTEGSDVLAEARAERERVKSITDITAEALSEHPNHIDVIEKLHDNAIQAGTSAQEYEIQILRAARPSTGLFRPRSAGSNPNLTENALMAAVCKAGRLEGHEESFTDQELSAADKHFPSGISLNELLFACAQANGYQGPRPARINPEIQAYAIAQHQVRASQNFSTINTPYLLSATANKFFRAGWDSIDMTPLRIAAIRPVSDFKTITTVSLTGDVMFEKVGAAGEIKHGSLGEVVYTNKADTYARMLAITRQDIINDDLGALTTVPKRLGRGAGLKLNDIFWAEFLNNSSFFSSGNNNVSTSTGTLTPAGLSAAYTIYLSQTDPDGKPLGSEPAILLVPTALKTTALELMNSERYIDGTSTAKSPDSNVWRGRFRVESSPYMHNTSYTGYSAAAWYMLADPNDLPVIEIVALNGKVEPTVESVDALPNVLGINMRGYSDVGVAKQEYRGGVRADGD